ncbi:hypothetical protein RD055328_08280 [Companilactobacillus sp. RD055328]|nr:hypothetical protein RD055328_08280 [Companilactobacillus sp. RD055328]
MIGELYLKNIITFPGQNKSLIHLKGRVGNLRGKTSVPIANLPTELVPSENYPISWYQPSNDDFSKVGIYVNAEQKCVWLSFTGGGPSNLLVDLNSWYVVDHEIK